jgi:hypothetical protein
MNPVPDKIEGWIISFACCRVCSQMWVAVVPVNVESESNLECPNCHSMSGELTE